MPMFSRLSPIRAYKDLRGFLLERSPWGLAFLLLAVIVTWVVVFVMLRDTNERPAYRPPQIQYVQQWSLDRTDAQIRAQEAIDEPIKEKRLADEARARDEQRAKFKRLDDKLKAYGI